jgi:hypothetical protein
LPFSDSLQNLRASSFTTDTIGRDVSFIFFIVLFRVRFFPKKDIGSRRGPNSPHRGIVGVF